MGVADPDTTKPVTVFHPDFTEGDIELVPADRSCCFRMQAITLRRTSQLFADMLSNAQPDSAQIALSEDKETIEMLLSVASGLALPVDALGDMDRLERLAYAAEKYEMRVALDLIRVMLRTRGLQRPELALRRYALATHFAWTDAADETLLAALDADLSSTLMPATLDARELARLVVLRERRVRTFVEQVDYTLRRACSCALSASSDPDAACWTAFKRAMVLATLSSPSGATVLTADAGALDDSALSRAHRRCTADGATCGTKRSARSALSSQDCHRRSKGPRMGVSGRGVCQCRQGGTVTRARIHSPHATCLACSWLRCSSEQELWTRGWATVGAACIIRNVLGRCSGDGGATDFAGRGLPLLHYGRSVVGVFCPRGEQDTAISSA